jgi:predicted peptidase
LFHGEEDDVIPVESSLLIYKYLKEKNKNIHFTLYPNVTHDSWTKTYEHKKVYDWLLSFKKM